ncbi:DUF2637 domain-containing protein [Mycobacterium simiae]|uniref:DUF2637 domain-containing protein n=1 Tax=Mycobacterium simiae TaxID=1784 RepID=UPI0020CB2783|nr:DUF2637 domain-containing protein [Mycobacterium simiae]
MPPYVSRLVIQIGAAAVPPIVLLVGVHGIALAVRAGASGMAYRCAVGAVAAIGAGAFVVSFLALRDMLCVIGYSSAAAWIFPAIIDTAVAVSTMMLVTLGTNPHAAAARYLPLRVHKHLGRIAYVHRLRRAQRRISSKLARPVVEYRHYRMALHSQHRAQRKPKGYNQIRSLHCS